MEDFRYTMHFFRVEGVASHRMDETTMAVLIMEYVRLTSIAVARRYLVVPAPAVVRGVKLFPQTVFMEAGICFAVMRIEQNRGKTTTRGRSTIAIIITCVMAIINVYTSASSSKLSLTSTTATSTICQPSILLWCSCRRTSAGRVFGMERPHGTT